MAAITEVELELHFIKAVRAYRETIIVSLQTGLDDKPSRYDRKDEVVKFFKMTTDESLRLKLQNIAYRTFFERENGKNADKLNTWLYALGGELAEELY